MQVTKPAKQRKMLYQAPLHIRYKHFSAPLSTELRASHIVNALPVRSGDTVRIMRGDRSGFEGKVTRIDRKKYRVFIEGLTREKVDGTTIFVPVHPSKVMITRLNLDDKWRKKILERKRATAEKLEKVEAEMPPKEVAMEKPIEPVKKPREKKTKPKRKPEIEEKPKPKRKKAPKKPIEKKEAMKEGKRETKAKKHKSTVKKPRSKPKSSKTAAAATSEKAKNQEKLGGKSSFG